MLFLREKMKTNGMWQQETNTMIYCRGRRQQPLESLIGQGLAGRGLQAAGRGCLRVRVRPEAYNSHLPL
jgi:hypothetical protein